MLLYSVFFFFFFFFFALLKVRRGVLYELDLEVLVRSLINSFLFVNHHLLFIFLLFRKVATRARFTGTTSGHGGSSHSSQSSIFLSSGR